MEGPVSEAPSVAPPAIQVAGEAGGASGRAAKPFGAGDALAEQCLATADAHRSGTAEAPGCPPDGLPDCATRCGGGDLIACRDLANAMKTELGEVACAAKLWQLSCERDELRSCVQLAEHLTSKDLVSANDRADAARLLERSCDGGWGAGCTALGRFFLLDGAGPTDGKRALQALEKGCDRGDATGCALAGKELSGSSDSKERARAVTRQEQACELGHHRSCVDLAVSLVYGTGVTQDRKRAQQILEQLCALDDSTDEGAACTMLAMLHQGAGGGHSSPQVEALLTRGCTKGDLAACPQVAANHYNGGRFTEAVAITDALVAKLPDNWLIRFARGMSLLNLGRFAEAEPQLVELCRLRSDWLHCELWLYAARERGGRDGKAQLRQVLQSPLHQDWPLPVVRYHLGKLSETGLLREAKHTSRQTELEQLCEAYYYIGQQHLIARRKRQAAKRFKQAVDTGISNFVEYTGAKAELVTLGAKP
ncbi:MAG: hypothetical protein JRI68_09040 [Deltaproteobacteria bacterium]|nr:hypothetical protein [Deltaproteobacteria bacterium]